MKLNDNEEKKDGLPPILSSSFKKTVSFGRTSGFLKSTGNIMKRLKNLSKKDMAFVGIGLGVLVMAPVAEYMMSGPPADNLLAPGFGGREQGSASGIFEPGINGLSQGSADGSGEVITPLSARDPLSLILGSQSSAPPMPAAAAPRVDLRDAMKDAGRSAFSAAAKSAGAPTPIPKMQGALRSVGSFFSGGESSRSADNLSGDKILQDARNASGKSAARSMLGPVAAAGYKGVASALNSSSKDAFEKLRAKAGRSAGNFSGESAISSLDKAAADALNAGQGTGGAGAGGSGEKTKDPSNSTNKNEHSWNKGEKSLSELAAEARQKAALDWEFYKKYEIPKQIITALMENVVTGGLIKPLGDMVNGTVNSMLGNYPPTQFCWQPAVCDDGDCREAVTENNVTAPVDLCVKFGAIGFKMEKAGKESTGNFQVKRCICGEGNAPTNGAPYIPGGTTPEDSPDATPGNAQPQVPDAFGKVFADYDTVLQDMVNQTVAAESNASDPAMVEASAKSVAGGFKNINIKVNDVVFPLLNSAKTKAGADLDGYSGRVGETQAKFTATQVKYQAFIPQVAALEKDLAEKKLKMKVHDGMEVIADEGTLTRVRAAIDLWKGQGPVYLNNADGLLASHRKKMTDYASQLSLVEGGIDSIRKKQSAANDAAESIISGEDGWPLKLKKMTGRGQDAVSADKGTEAVPPVKQVATGLRALDWDTLWAAEHKFDSSRVAAEEKQAWGDWQKKITVSLGQPDNFVSNLLRSGEIQQAIVGALPDFSNVEGMLSDTETSMGKTKRTVTGSGVDSCYFADGGCGAVPENPANPVNPSNPVNPDPNTGGGAQAGLTSSANALYSTYSGKLSAAQSAYANLPPKNMIDPKSQAEYGPLLAQAGKNMDELRVAVKELEGIKAALATPNLPPAKVAELKAKLAAAQPKLEKASTAVDAGVKAAADFARLHPLSPAGGLTLQGIKSEGTKAFNKIITAYGQGKPKWAAFPSGNSVSALRAAAEKEWNKLQSCLAAAEPLHNTTNAATENTRKEALTALETLRTKAEAAELALKKLNDAFEAAGKISDKCWERAEGCRTLSNFYMHKNWKVRKQKLTAGSAYAEADGAEGQAWDWAYANRPGVYSSWGQDDRESVCRDAWASVPWWRYALNFRLSAAVEDCKAKWFIPVFGIQHRSEPVESRGVFTSFTLARTVNGKTSKTYEGEAQKSEFTGKLKVLCGRSDGAWRTTSVSFLVHKPITQTYPEGISISAGQSFFKMGSAVTNGAGTTVHFGEWQALTRMHGVNCGGDAD